MLMKNEYLKDLILFLLNYLDDFQLKGEAQLIDGVSDAKWYKTLAEWARENIWFSTAIILNIIWWGYQYIKRLKYDINKRKI
jgi:hypothetical protein